MINKKMLKSKIYKLFKMEKQFYNIFLKRTTKKYINVIKKLIKMVNIKYINEKIYVKNSFKQLI